MQLVHCLKLHISYTIIQDAFKSINYFTADNFPHFFYRVEVSGNISASSANYCSFLSGCFFCKHKSLNVKKYNNSCEKQPTKKVQIFQSIQKRIKVSIQIKLCLCSQRLFRSSYKRFSKIEQNFQLQNIKCLSHSRCILLKDNFEDKLLLLNRFSKLSECLVSVTYILGNNKTLFALNEFSPVFPKE